MTPEAISELVTEWKRRSQRLFQSAESARNDFEKKALKHAAMIYFNCSAELSGEQPAKLPLSFVFEDVQQQAEGP